MEETIITIFSCNLTEKSGKVNLDITFADPRGTGTAAVLWELPAPLSPAPALSVPPHSQHPTRQRHCGGRRVERGAWTPPSPTHHQASHHNQSLRGAIFFVVHFVWHLQAVHIELSIFF